MTPSSARKLPLQRLLFLALLILSAAAMSCENTPSDEDLVQSLEARVRVMGNFTGTNAKNGIDPEVDNILIQMIDRSRSTLDFAVMGLSRQPVIDALIRAHLRGVRLRFVGDARHMEGGTTGYLQLDRYNIPMIVGNQFHIMHDKFFIADDRWIFTGTGNITTTGFDKNNNNFAIIDDPFVAADFKAEFEQMFSGLFGSAKVPIDNGRTYQVGDTEVEVYFSPQEDAAGRLLQGIEEAKESVYFMIFAFTKDQVGSALINKHQEFMLYNVCCDPERASERDSDAELGASCTSSVACEDTFRSKEVRGVIDRSQLHSNGPYHEFYRLSMFGVPMRLDGNDNSFQPGDYQAGGGRLHSKTLIVDPGIPSAKVLTGSFNWSSSATTANDETLLVLAGERVTADSMPYFNSLWENAKGIGEDFVGKGDGKVTAGVEENGTFTPGSVIFNEIHWDGYNGDNDPTDFGGDDVYNDEFIELLNTTDQAIDMSLWVMGTQNDFTMGFYPGTIIGPHERFLILDHNLRPYIDTLPQDDPQAFEGADFVMNPSNDPRFLRLNLRNADFVLKLIDARGTVIDTAGDGGPPFAGGRQSIPVIGADGVQLRNEQNRDLFIRVNRSMERVHPIQAGDKVSAWVASTSKSEGASKACPPALSSSTTPWRACQVGTDDWRACYDDGGNSCTARVTKGVNVREPYRHIVFATPGEINAAGEVYPNETVGYRAPAPAP